MKEQPLRLHEIGEVGYGTHWMTEMGRDIRVGDRTMRYWAGDDGAAAIPPGMEAELCSALLERARKILGLVHKIREVGIDRTVIRQTGFQTQVRTTMRAPGQLRERPQREWKAAQKIFGKYTRQKDGQIFNWWGKIEDFQWEIRTWPEGQNPQDVMKLPVAAYGDLVAADDAILKLLAEEQAQHAIEEMP